MKISNMGSSKYEFDPEQFDKDVADKNETLKHFEMSLKQVISKTYRYSDGSQLSNKAKREILIKVHKDFMGVE